MYSKLKSIYQKYSFMNRSAILDTVLVSVSVVFASVMAYILQFFLGRNLSIEDYGNFGALLSMSYLIGVPASVFGLSLTKLISELYASKPEILPHFFKSMRNLSIMLGLVLFLILFAFSGILNQNLKINDIGLVLIFAFASSFSFFSLIPTSFLQGIQRFRGYSIYIILYGAFRAIFPILLVILGYKLFGVFIGMALAAVVGFAYSYIHLKDLFKSSGSLQIEEKNFINGFTKKLFYFALPVLLVNLGMMFTNNIDVLMVKTHFDPTSAGLYVGLVTVGKVLLFGASTVITVMFPILTAEYTRKTLTLSKFLTFFGLQVVVVLCGMAMFNFLPKLIVSVMFGAKYLPIVEYLPHFSIFVGLYVLVNFMILFFLSISRTKVFLIQIPFALLQLYLLNKYNDSVNTYININIAVTAGLLAVLFVYGYIQYLSWKKITPVKTAK